MAAMFVVILVEKKTLSQPCLSLYLWLTKLMEFWFGRTRFTLSCIACIYSISKPQWHVKDITGRQPKHKASLFLTFRLFLVAVLA